MDKKQLNNCIDNLKKCVVKKKPKVILDQSKINGLEFSVAITKVSQAIKQGVITEYMFIKKLRRAR